MGRILVAMSPAATTIDPIVRVKGEAGGAEFIALITLLMAMTAMGIDIMLPAFPDIRAEFGMPADSTQVAWILTAFFLGMAIGPWVFGPASDRFGRKRLMVAGLVMYMAAALAATLAPTWELLVISRFVWGVAAGGPRTLSVAMVRDRYDGNAMARLMSTIMAIFLLVPILAPGLGAGLIAVFPWRSVFVFPAIVALVLLVWSRRLVETLPVEKRRAFTWRSVGQAGREVVSHRSTVTMTIAMTFLFGVMTAYLGSAEIILEDVYDYAVWFPLWFGVIAVVLAVSSLNNARLVGRLGVVRLVRRLTLLSVLGGAVLVGVSFSGGGIPNFWVLTIVLMVVLPMAQGTTPNANTIAMSPVPHVAGTASAVIATVTIAGGSLLGTIASDAFDGTVRPYAIFTAAYVAAAAMLIWWGTSGSRST
jgi:MFS transporter, DHA1 family, multidrug resistance protein